MMTARAIRLSPHMAFNLKSDPKRLGFILARYAFAAQMSEYCENILELGCSEGVGALMLHKGEKDYLGLDLDPYAIAAAKNNYATPKVCFEEVNFLGAKYGCFDAVVSLDVVEHIMPGEDEALFFKTILDNVSPSGMCVIGTPNLTSSPYASPGSQKGHVNLFDAERLKCTVGKYFKTVFIFSMNDEVVHTGYYPMAHYLFAIGCAKRGKVIV